MTPYLILGVLILGAAFFRFRGQIQGPPRNDSVSSVSKPLTGTRTCNDMDSKALFRMAVLAAHREAMESIADKNSQQMAEVAIKRWADPFSVPAEDT